MLEQLASQMMLIYHTTRHVLKMYILLSTLIVRPGQPRVSK